MKIRMFAAPSAWVVSLLALLLSQLTLPSLRSLYESAGSAIPTMTAWYVNMAPWSFALPILALAASLLRKLAPQPALYLNLAVIVLSVLWIAGLLLAIGTLIILAPSIYA